MLKKYLTAFFEKEDATKLGHVEKMANKWKTRLHELDNLLIERYGKTLLYHTFFRKINLRSLCANVKTVDINFITESLREHDSLTKEESAMILSVFEKTSSMSKELFLSLFELSYTPLCVITASYNNEEICKKYANSILKQTYMMYRVIYVDDCSTDDTLRSLKRCVIATDEENKFTYLRTEKNMKQAYAKKKAYSMADKDEVLVFLDGDDWLANHNAFHILNQAYIKYPENNITCGSFQTFYNNAIVSPQNDIRHTLQCSMHKVSNCRQDKQWKYSHLRTGRCWLFQNIPDRFLQDKNGNWLECCTDVAEMYWALDQCSTYIHVDNVLLTYNKDNSMKYENSFYNKEYKTRRDEILKHIRGMKHAIPVDSIHIIHMQKRLERKKRTDSQLQKYVHQPYSYFPAIDGSDTSFAHIYEMYKSKYSHEKQYLTKGALGLIASYSTLLHQIMQSTDDSILLLEDDVLFNLNFEENIKKYTSEFETYDIVYLGANQQNWDEVEHEKNGYVIHPGFFKWTYGTFAVMLKRPVFEALYLELCSKPVYEHNLPVDCMINVLAEKHGFSVFVCFPNLIIADLQSSDISEPRDMDEWSEKLHWDLDQYETINIKDEESFYSNE